VYTVSTHERSDRAELGQKGVGRYGKFGQIDVRDIHTAEAPVERSHVQQTSACKGAHVPDVNPIQPYTCVHTPARQTQPARTHAHAVSARTTRSIHTHARSERSIRPQRPHALTTYSPHVARRCRRRCRPNIHKGVYPVAPGCRGLAAGAASIIRGSCQIISEKFQRQQHYEIFLIIYRKMAALPRGTFWPKTHKRNNLRPENGFPFPENRPSFRENDPPKQENTPSRSGRLFSGFRMPFSRFGMLFSCFTPPFSCSYLL
jgi:hypothetical protein